MALTFRGHSGCSLELIGKDIVRKTSHSFTYNSRLFAQVQKQKSFCHTVIQTPSIINTGVRDGLFFCDMEYIRGVSFQDYCSAKSYSDIKELFSKLIVRSTETKDFTEDIYKKCLSLENFPMNLLSKVSWNLPVGSCHGDLTFENILIKEKEIYVIDFLDSFIDSPAMDHSKLMQDTFCAWSFEGKNSTPWHHLYLLNNIIQSKRNYILLLIHLYRILPYGDKKIKNLVKCKIQKVKETLKKF
tara:strand:- start:3173 stop:3901 length:729 start_codon:yes stop_codon:yes gene_type:complete